MNYLKYMQELQFKHPRMSILQVNCENSPYVNYTGNSKNCYLLVGSEYDQDCYYGYFLYNSEDCVDCDYCFYCQLCYDCVDCHQCYDCRKCQDCKNSRSLQYSEDLIGCTDCFGCVGLRRKEYHIFNEKYDREKYFAALKGFQSLEGEEIERRVEALKCTTPRIMVHGDQNENAFGDYLYNCKNCFYCFDVKQLQDCGYMNNCEQITDSYDCSNNYYKSELNYEVMSAMNIANCHFCYGVFDSYDLEYSENIYGSHHLFGCFTMKGRSYCIFNEQYSPEEWPKKVAEIKALMRREGTYGKHLTTTYPELAIHGFS
ncbi:MAG: hypothetical protein UT36_C0008G0021 [Candidatus Peregrinibacteria bacterium GW2011_GWF2_39_17]|nr:MAG: hypothetical protein UT36_C0008G0021 [Candidatus Peregrinibacteria bacterium GW2011_GWF2_39_17]HCW32059.1 hypothetical protein [Candidatus Peregrinibacteria bacterium]